MTADYSTGDVRLYGHELALYLNEMTGVTPHQIRTTSMRARRVTFVESMRRLHDGR